MVARFADKEVAPRAAEIDRRNTFPMDLWEKMGDQGLLGITAEEEYGGSSRGYLDHTLVMEEVGRSLLGSHTHVGASYRALPAP
jgi:isovaleryl-CoA dehydrogenase